MLYDLSCCLVHVNYYCFITGNLFDLHYHARSTTEVKDRTDSHRSVQSIWARQEHVSPPGSLPTAGSTTAAASWVLDYHPSSEVTFAVLCKLHGCPTSSSTTWTVLNWLIFLAARAMCSLFCFFRHLPRVEAVLAALNPCIWRRKLQAVCAIKTSLADLLWLIFCCSLARALSDNLTGSCLALTVARI